MQMCLPHTNPYICTQGNASTYQMQKLYYKKFFFVFDKVNTTSAIKQKETLWTYLSYERRMESYHHPRMQRLGWQQILALPPNRWGHPSTTSFLLSSGLALLSILNIYHLCLLINKLCLRKDNTDRKVQVLIFGNSNYRKALHDAHNGILVELSEGLG